MRNRAYMTFLLSLVMAALSLSCTKIDRIYDSGNVEIALSARSSLMTRTTEDYPKEKVFGVYAYTTTLDGGTAWKPALADSDLYLENVRFKSYHDGENVVAKGDGKSYYWPLSGSMLFYGYSPHIEESEDCIKSVSHSPNVQSPTDANAYFAIDFQQKDDPAKMQELMWFDAKDVEGGVSLTKNDDVTVTFRRAHAKVTVNIEYEYYKKVSLRLTECISRGIFYSGATPGWMPDASKDADGNYEYLESYMLFNEERQGDKDKYEGTVSMFMMPQYTDGFFDEVGVQIGGDMMLEFTIKDGDLGNETVVSVPLKNYTEKWEMGRHYIYNISVMPKRIEYGEPIIEIRTDKIAI